MTPMTSMRAQEKKWQAESDLEAMIRAAEVRKDKARFKAAKALAAERLKNTAAAVQAVQPAKK